MRRFLPCAAMILIATSASAVYKCVTLQASAATGDADYYSGTGQINGPEWWSGDSNNVTINGIAMCSTDVNSGYGEIADKLTLGTANLYCWCKMISPAISERWVSADYFTTESNCQYSCSGVCARLGAIDEEFRSLLFTPLYD